MLQVAHLPCCTGGSVAKGVCAYQNEDELNIPVSVEMGMSSSSSKTKVQGEGPKYDSDWITEITELNKCTPAS